MANIADKRDLKLKNKELKKENATLKAKIFNQEEAKKSFNKIQAQFNEFIKVYGGEHTALE
jgi:hypothetical protein